MFILKWRWESKPILLREPRLVYHSAKETTRWRKCNHFPSTFLPENRERKNNRWRFDFSSFWFVAIDVLSLFTPRFKNKNCNFHFFRITTSVNIFKMFIDVLILKKWKLQFLFSNLGVNNDKTSMATNQKDEKSNRQRLFLRSLVYSRHVAFAEWYWSGGSSCETEVRFPPPEDEDTFYTGHTTDVRKSVVHPKNMTDRGRQNNVGISIPKSPINPDKMTSFVCQICT